MTLAASDAEAGARVAAFRTLEAIADPRALEPALRAIGDSDSGVALAAIGVVRVFLHSSHSAQAVDRLTAAALDGARPSPVRVAALRALADLGPATLAPLVDTLAQDPAPDVRAAAATADRRKAPTRVTPSDALTAAAERGLPDDPDTLKRAVVHGGADVPLTALLRIVERVREREALEPARQAEWASARAAGHVALASRGSRLGLYDLRESLEGGHDRLPVELLAALSLAGDQSCLEPIAVAFGRSGDDWFRERLADAFRTIVQREQLTRRHAAVKKIEARWPDALRALWPHGPGRSGGVSGSGGAGKAGRAG
jgi:HEAT repeat protein